MGLPRGQGTRDAEAAAQKEQRAATRLDLALQTPEAEAEAAGNGGATSPKSFEMPPPCEKGGGRGEWASEIIIIPRFCRGS